MLKSEIHGRDPATFLNYGKGYKKTCHRKKIGRITNFGPYPPFLEVILRCAPKILKSLKFVRR